MSNLIREGRYIKSDHKKNNNKFWYIFEYDDATIKTEFGRVGDKGQSKTKPFTSQEAATKFFDKKIKEKTRAGRNGEIAYEPLDVVSSNGSGQVTVTEDLESIAKKEITYNCPEVEKLISFLTQVNIHNITSNTIITYNTQTGLFETPCGIVTQNSIDKARDLLVDISDYVEDDNLTSNYYGDLLNKYLMLIPQNVGRKYHPETLYTSLEDVRKQNDILDSLQASLQSVLNSDSDDENEVEREKLFSLKLNKVDDYNIIKHVKKLYTKTWKSYHTCSNLKVKRVFNVDIENMRKEFNLVKDSIGNIQELWHGTKASNLLSILKGGLIIPPANASHCCGRMFGQGLYFSDQSTKSLNYAHGYWSGSYDKTCYMFLCDVAMGKSYTPDSYRETLPKKGYDSTFAKGGESGVKNNEMIVYKLNQCNLKYLVEFE